MVILVVIVMTPCFALGYSVSYGYDVYVQGGTNVHIMAGTKDNPLLLEDGVTSTSGSITQTANTGESGDKYYGVSEATVQYYADLATGGIKSYANVWGSGTNFFAGARLEKIGLTFLFNMLNLLSIKISRFARNDKKGNCHSLRGGGNYFRRHAVWAGRFTIPDVSIKGGKV